MENFEGVTQHKNNRFFMISDDNKHMLLQSIVVYFELLKKK